MKKHIYIVVCFAIASLSSFGLKAETSKELKELMHQNLELSEAEDIAGIMATVHSQSPIYLSQKLALENIFPVYDLEYELLEFEFIGEGDKYAYVRIKFSTKKISGGQFRDNDLDALTIFRKENGKWKLWNQANLEFKFK